MILKSSSKMLVNISFYCYFLTSSIRNKNRLTDEERKMLQETTMIRHQSLLRIITAATNTKTKSYYMLPIP